MSGRVLNDLQIPAPPPTFPELWALLVSAPRMFGGYVLFQSAQEPVTLLIVSHVLERDGKKR